ncbi:MAG: uracil phosphoribosyltransferase [Bdellovibrionales bacterium]
MKSQKTYAYEQAHSYGSQVTLVNDIYLNSLLTKLSQPQTIQPQVLEYVETLFAHLFVLSMGRELKHAKVRVATRMTAFHKDQKLDSEVIDPKQKAVCVSLARAGIPASQVGYKILNHTLQPDLVRQDHVWAARLTDEKDQVTGAGLGGVKIGGDVADTTVFLADPMGATGSTIVTTLELYKKKFKGKKARFVCLHLIITPEFLKNVLSAHPDIRIYALRLDRGLSPKNVLGTPPGTHWDKERGLNDKQYIVPGAGGLGEILNNAFV